MNIEDPTGYTLDAVTINGEDVRGLFQNISVYESIYSPGITGTITLLDSDSNNLVEDGNIQFIEPFYFQFTNARDESLIFNGFLNKLKNKVAKAGRNLYEIEFVSSSIRKNEENLVFKAFKKEEPETIIEEMINLIGEKNEIVGTGEPMTFVGSGWKAARVMEYVCVNGVFDKSKSQVSVQKDGEEPTLNGTTGFLCFETLDGFRFVAIDQILTAKCFQKHEDYVFELANRSYPLEKATKIIMDYHIDYMGDFFQKQRSGADAHTHVSFDMDKGEWVEFEWDSWEQVNKTITEEQFKLSRMYIGSEDYINVRPTRVITSIINNERANDKSKCDKEDDDSIDQQRKTLSQNIVRENTFQDVSATFTLAPQFVIRAGDTISVKIQKVTSEDSKDRQPNKRHSGEYIIRQVGHHINADGHAYTKLNTLRSTVFDTDPLENQDINTDPIQTQLIVNNNMNTVNRGNDILFEL